MSGSFTPTRSSNNETPFDAWPAVASAIASGNHADAEDILLSLDTPDIVMILDRLSDLHLQLLLGPPIDRFQHEILARIDPIDARRLLERVDVELAVDLLESIRPDDATDIVELFDPQQVEAILLAMDPEEAEDIRELLAYDPDTAGGVMTSAFVSITPAMRADQTIAALRLVAEEAETVNYVYVLDSRRRLLGVLSLFKLVFAHPTTPVSDLMFTNLITVHHSDDKELAALRLQDHQLMALPVVDDDGVLLGIITADDVSDVLEREATEDFERLGGSNPLSGPYLRTSPFELVRKRIVWLFVLFIAQAYTSNVIDFFSADLERVVALALFIPMLIGIGGNVGSQVVTTIVRAMAIGDVRFRDAFTVVRKELLVGVILGVVLAAMSFGRAVLLPDVSVRLGLTVAIAVVTVIIWSATVGAVLPLLLSKLKVDPAVVSAPLITTLVDGTGLMIYFMAARLILFN